MKTYKIPVFWTMSGIVEIQAESIEEAILMADDAPLPENGEYMECSFEVDEHAIQYHNPNMDN
jgi:hypothetical protein